MINDLPEDIHDLQDYALYLESEKHALESQLAAHAWTLLNDDKGRAELPGYEGITASVYFPKLDKCVTHFVYYRRDGDKKYCYHGNGVPIEDGIVYAYQPKPAPAPYPVREEE